MKKYSLETCVPQRHAAGDCRFSGDVYQHVFTGSLLIEVMFSLNGLGLLGYEATVSRDYPVMFGTLYIFTLIGLLLNIVSDISYTLVDPRIDFEDVNVATQPRQSGPLGAFSP